MSIGILTALLLRILETIDTPAYVLAERTGLDETEIYEWQLNLDENIDFPIDKGRVCQWISYLLSEYPEKCSEILANFVRATPRYITI